MSNDLHKTILTLLSENTEKEKIESLGGIARNPQDERKDWEAKAKPMKGLNSTIQTDTGEVVPAKPFGVMPDGGEWEYQWRGTKLDAANGTYTNQGEYNRQKFKQIVQQPAEPVQHTSTTVSESKTRLDKILETVDQLFESSYDEKIEKFKRGHESGSMMSVIPSQRALKDPYFAVGHEMGMKGERVGPLGPAHEILAKGTPTRQRIARLLRSRRK